MSNGQSNVVTNSRHWIVLPQLHRGRRTALEMIKPVLCFLVLDQMKEVDMRFLRMLSIPTILVGAFFILFAGSALASTTSHSQSQAASLYRPFPEGIDQYNAQTALSQVMSRASWDDQYGRTIAQQTGAASFDSAQYSTLGYASRAPAGTTNSGLSGSGYVVPVADHGGSQFVKVLLVMNIVTKQTVSIMVRCGNPRLHPFVKVLPWKPFSKGTIVYVNRSVSKPVSITCPSGQTVSGTITATVKGTIRARTWGQVQGNLNLKLQQAVDLQVKVFATLKCGAAPPVTPPPPTGSCNAVNSPGAIVCSSFYVIITCNGGQITLVGSTAKEAMDKANAYVCNTTTPPPVTPPPAPGNFTATGSTPVLSNKNLTAPCPAPNQGIVKSGSGSASLNSPTFTGHGTTQAAADADLASQLATWRNNNQGTVDAQAQAAAQANLNTALQSCPAPLPATFTANATASATATVNCPTGSTTATASATASGSGSATSSVSQADADQKANVNATASATANAQAAASAKCQAAPVNRPPVVQIVNGPAHVFMNGQIQICASFSDPDNDGLQVSWSAARGTVSNGRECVSYTAPSTEGNDTVTVTVSDGLHSVQASVSFPIVKDQF